MKTLMNVSGVTLAPASSVNAVPAAIITVHEAWVHRTSFFQHPTPVIGWSTLRFIPQLPHHTARKQPVSRGVAL
jgi:hypothetical protein